MSQEIRSVADVPAELRNQRSQPLSPELIAQQMEQARRNQGRDFRDDLEARQEGQRPSKTIGQRVRQKVDAFFGDAVQTAPEAASPMASAPVSMTDHLPVADALESEAPLPPPEAHQLAASDTDTPSRGIPRPIDDPNKVITGGFGAVGEAQYFPLDGQELGAVLIAKLEQMIANIKTDLRFSLAVTYPRVRAFVEIAVEGFSDVQNDFKIKAVAADEKRTPIEVAREHGDEVCFVLLDAHVEMLPDGTSVTPPNQAREDAGLPVPMKQRNDAGFIVDRR